MKRVTLAILLVLAGVHVFAQKKSGTVYIEHDAIETSRALWKATVEGDVEKFRSFFADTAMISTNGEQSPPVANADLGKGLDKWAASYDNLEIKDDKPAYPDAIEYKEGGTWVQDWLLMTGTHKESGISLSLPVHCLYAFNEEGKVQFMVRYFNNDVFEEISKSSGKRENGKVYISHPYITNTRKAMNAFVAKDVEKMRQYYAKDARFSMLTAGVNDSWSFDENLEGLKKKLFKEDLKFKVEQMGYPDCIFYEESQAYVVYSWWIFKTKDKDGKYMEFAFMVSQDYNDEGKITREHTYVSSNHLDKF